VGTFTGKSRASGATTWKATRVDLVRITRSSNPSNTQNSTHAEKVFGSNSELRAISIYFACADSQDLFLEDFVAAVTLLQHYCNTILTRL
jgi:catalase-peroxidase